MAKTGKGSSGLLIAAAVGLGAFALLRQGQATATTLNSARLKGFQLKGWNGTTLSALAQVEFNNSNVSRDVQLQEIGLDISHEGTSLGTAHLKDGRVLAANSNTTLPIPVTMNVGSLLAKLGQKFLLTGRAPSLKSFTSLSKVTSWLQDNISPESLRMQGTAKVNGLVVSFDQAIPLENYLPSAPRSGPVDQLPRRTSRPSSTSVPATVTPRPVDSAPVTSKAASTRKAGRAAAIVRKGAGIVRQAASTVRSIKQARPTAGKVRKPTRPARRRDDGLPPVNLPTTRG